MRIEEYKRIVSNMTLEDIELTGGHILARHFEQSDSDLIHRCIESGKKLCTTFTVQREEILKMIQDDLLDEEYETPACIIEWLNDDADGGDFYAVKDFEKQIGKGFFRQGWHQWDNGPAPCHSLNVVLRKVERKMDTTFQIITAYPTVTEHDILEMRHK